MKLQTTVLKSLITNRDRENYNNNNNNQNNNNNKEKKKKKKKNQQQIGHTGHLPVKGQLVREHTRTVEWYQENFTLTDHCCSVSTN